MLCLINLGMSILKIKLIGQIGQNNFLSKSHKKIQNVEWKPTWKKKIWPFPTSQKIYILVKFTGIRMPIPPTDIIK